MARLLLLLAIFAATPVEAIVRRHDRADSLYVEAGRKVSAVVDMNLPGGAGTLIAPAWVLTAAHVTRLIKLPHEVVIAGERFAIRKIVSYPDGDVGRDDIALVQLEREVTSVKPVRLDDGRAKVGMDVLFAGRGFSGDGNRGPIERDRTLRAATNRIDRLLEKWIVFTFDEASTNAVTELEGISGPGDSGGPAFIDVDGKRFIAGVSSGQNDHGKGEGRYGVEEFYVRVSAYKEWIEKSMRFLAIRGGTVVDSAAVIANATILVRGAEIEKIGVSFAVPPDATVVDARGKFIVPGFIDNHVHVGRTGASEDWLRHGVTTLVDNGSRVILPGASSCGRIITAPGGYPAVGVKDSPALEVTTVEEVVRYLDHARPSCVKLAIERGFLADYDSEGWPVLDPDLIRAVVVAAHARGLMTRAHVTQAREFEIAIDSGVDVISHTPIVSLSDDLLRKAADRRVILVTTASLWNDPKLEKIVASNVSRYLHDFGGRVAIGSDFPNTPAIGIAAELESLARDRRFKPADALTALTTSGAAAIGRNDVGVLREGARADIVVLARDPRESFAAFRGIVAVIQGGVLRWTCMEGPASH